MKKRKLRLNRTVILFVLTACILSACGSKPSWVLSDEKMEDVMFDIHLAEAEVEDNYVVFNGDSAKKQELLNTVFKKHKMTEQEFDTSLVWYAGNLDQYFKIYENLIKRYAVLSDTLHADQIKESLNLTDLNLVNLWQGSKTHALHSAALLQNTFTFRVDSADFQQGDTYELRFDLLGLHDSIQPSVTFCAQQSDTMFISRSCAKQNGPFMATLFPSDTSDTKALFGSIYLPMSFKNGYLVIHNFAVYQRKKPTLEKK